MVIYAMQVVVPCSSCGFDTPAPTCSSYSCSGCEGHEEPSNPKGCECKIELPPVSWDSSKSDFKGELKILPTQFSVNWKPPFSEVLNHVIPLALPPPQRSKVRALYGIYLI